MIAVLVAGLLGAAASSQASPPPTQPAASARKPPEPELDMELRPVLTDALIKKAVRETIAEDPRPSADANRDVRAYGAITPYTRFGAAFDEARVPDCLHADALKHQPAVIGPITVVGPYSLPWVIAAAVRGKCN